MPNLLGQPLVATDPNQFIQNYNQTRQVNNQTRGLNLQEKQMLMEAMDKQEQKQRQRDIDEALEAAAESMPQDWPNLPQELKWAFVTAVHAKDQKQAMSIMDKIAEWKKGEDFKEQRTKTGQQIFPTRTQAPAEPVDQERLTLQNIYSQGGMADVENYGQAMKAMQPESMNEPLQSVVGPDGKPVLVPRSQAAGMSPASTDSMSFDEERAYKPFFDNLIAQFIQKNGREPNPAERNQLSFDAWTEVQRRRAQLSPQVQFPTHQDVGMTEDGKRLVFNTRTGRYSTVEGAATIGKQKSAIAGSDLKSITDVFNSMRMLDVMEKNIGKTGIITGKVNQAGAYVGNDPAAQEFDAAQKQFKLSAQSLIKGIPSNFDVETLIDTLPAFGLSQSMNQQRIKRSREIAKAIIGDVIAYHKGTNKIIPKYIEDRAKNMGVEPGAVNPWDGDSDPMSNTMKKIGGSSQPGSGVSRDDALNELRRRGIIK